MHGIARDSNARRAQELSSDISYADYTIRYRSKIEINYRIDEIIQNIVRHPDALKAILITHFYSQHCSAGYAPTQFKIRFLPKEDGSQIGIACEINRGPYLDTRYFVKTHQNGRKCGFEHTIITNC